MSTELYAMLAENITDPVRRQRFFDEGSATASAARGARQPGSTTGTRARAHAAALGTDASSTRRRCASRRIWGPSREWSPTARHRKAATQDEFVQLVAGHLGACQDRGRVFTRMRF